MNYVKNYMGEKIKTGVAGKMEEGGRVGTEGQAKGYEVLKSCVFCDQ